MIPSSLHQSFIAPNVRTFARQVLITQPDDHGLWQHLGVYAHFAELDWKPRVTEIDRLMREQEELAASSDILRTLQGQLRELDAAQVQVKEQCQPATRQQATSAEKPDQARKQRHGMPSACRRHQRRGGGCLLPHAGRCANRRWAGIR